MTQEILSSIQNNVSYDDAHIVPASPSVHRPITSSSVSPPLMSAAANNNYENIEISIIPSDDMAKTNQEGDDDDDDNYCIDSGDELFASDDNDHVSDNDDDDIESENGDNSDANDIYRENLRNWAMQFRINHVAINNLLQIINSREGKKILPHDARTLLRTPATVIPVQALSSGGEYWHNGLAKCLSNAFQNLNKPISISLNINIDGLPAYNSSKVSFWPILFNIFEFPKMPPMVIGIYCGATKITDIATYFSPFVDELEAIMAAL